VQPFGPLGVQSSVWLLVLRFEDCDDLAVGVLDEVTAAAALVDALRVNTVLDSVLCRSNQLRELGVV